MLRKLYDHVLAIADHRFALWGLALIAFAEASFFPIPPDVIMIPMILARPHQAFRIAFIATAASVLGGVFGYMLGALFYDNYGQALLEFFGHASHFEAFKAEYNALGIWAVLGAGFTPFPFKVITVLSGAASLPLGVFILSAIIARGGRFFLVAVLLWKYGPAIRVQIERYLGPLSLALFLMLAGGALWLYLV